MLASPESSSSVRVAGKRSLLPAPFAACAFGSVFLIPLLAGQPKEVTVGVGAAYVALMAVVAGVIFEKKNRRNMAIGAALTCAAFMSLFVYYAYLAYNAPR